MPATSSPKDLDFIQAQWKLLIAALLAASALIAIIFNPSSHLLQVYVISSIWTAWNIYAYAAGKSFHVSPGISAQANDSRNRRRIILAVSMLMELFFSGLVIYSFYRTGL